MGSIEGGTTLMMQRVDTFSPSSNCINAAWGTTGNLIINKGNGLKGRCLMHLTVFQLQDVYCCFCA